MPHVCLPWHRLAVPNAVASCIFAAIAISITHTLLLPLLALTWTSVVYNFEQTAQTTALQCVNDLSRTLPGQAVSRSDGTFRPAFCPEATSGSCYIHTILREVVNNSVKCYSLSRGAEHCQAAAVCCFQCVQVESRRQFVCAC
jgi:hypothetical protein